MKIAIIGATGFVGSALVNEFSDRKHEITAIARTPKDTANATWVAADVYNADALAEILKGHDVVVNAFNPGWSNPNIYEDSMKGSKAIQEAVKKSGVKRFITIGGAGSLFVAPGLQAIDTPDFPKEIFDGANAARHYLDIIKEEKDLDWAFFSPAFEMHAGTKTGRTGKYRLGLDNPVFNDEQRSILSVEDLAVVIADEVETPKHHQVRFTAGY
ncbi:putative NADH-flavin reductase [Flavobacterium nitrogenifigens]|uniref:NADH-flavin reductase n=2 Tax=Flavobacterium TaxID=237 RepID=A0ABR6QAV6_9FLAO|nr:MULTISPECIES: NAD(P)H-binding protein [Flavobacterium]MBB4801385.1 putative NADH-flavin reductase [Flavobacterium nitrogenifigens]MBB6386342.1 putative NADH-flavin reductase [Flavobacterium notoginsengisoli]